MDVLHNNKAIRNISFVYFVFTLILVISEILSYKPMVYFFKLSIIPLLLLLYCVSSKKRNAIYIVALLFSFLANVCMLEPTLEHMLYGQIAYTIYRFFSVVLVFKIIKETKILSLLIAFIPFFSLFSYLLVLIEKRLLVVIYPSVINITLMALLGGVSLASYIFNDNKKNTFFLISSILFTAQIFVLTIQKQFFLNAVFQPITVLIYAVSHYVFFRFVLEDESENLVLREL